MEFVVGAYKPDHTVGAVRSFIEGRKHNYYFFFLQRS